MTPAPRSADAYAPVAGVVALVLVLAAIGLAIAFGPGGDGAGPSAPPAGGSGGAVVTQSPYVYSNPNDRLGSVIPRG